MQAYVDQDTTDLVSLASQNVFKMITELPSLDLQDTLLTHFGFKQFRPLQEEIVRSILAGKDTVALLPTGGGKSICFQLPGVLLSGVCLVISPLISLMNDQVFHLRVKKIRAVALNSTVNAEKQLHLLTEIVNGRYKFVYLSPEKLQSKVVQDILPDLKIGLVVIDEAHCVSQWGHQFRPEYTQIPQCFSCLSYRPPIAAFTASATPRTLADLIQHLSLNQPVIFRQSVLRKNLSLSICHCPSRTIQYIFLQRLLRRYHNQPVLIYCATRQQTEDVAHKLSQQGVLTHFYHGGMETTERATVQKKFLANTIQVVCCTTAFGMGVDKPNVRCVIHLALPSTIEGYYQEVGRAGRDGQPSTCYLLPLPGDAQLQTEILERSQPHATEIRQILTAPLQSAGRSLLFKNLFTSPLHERHPARMRAALQYGVTQGWWVAHQQLKQLTFVLPISEIKKVWHKKAKHLLHQLYKLRAVQRFTTARYCRMRQLLLYFEPHAERKKYQLFTCQRCDICTNSLAALQPSLLEKKLFKRVQRRWRAQYPHSTKLQELCINLLLTNSTFSMERIAQLPGIGRGLLTQLSTLDLQFDITSHQQTHADGSTLVSQSPRSPLTS